MSIATGDIYRTTITWHMVNQVCNTVLHHRATMNQSGTTFVNQAMDGHLARVLTLAQGMASLAHTSVWFEKAVMTPVITQVAGYERTRVLDINGGSTGELLPGLLALPFNIHTPFHGRSRRGRVHIGGWVETDQDAGRLVGPGITKAEAFAPILQTHMGGNWPFKGIIFSRKIHEREMQQGSPASQIEGANGVPWAYASAVTHGTLLGTMYSRKIGVGS